MSLNLEDAVVKNLERGYLCSESVIKGAAEYLGMPWEHLPAIATGLGGGIGGTAGVCGALTGAVLALGLATGRNAPDQDFYACAGLVQELVDRFRERFASTDCVDVLGLDLRTDEGRIQAMAKGLPNLPCKECCLFVARYIAENTSPSR
ncbi:C-GCAxxG-C-C family protein [Fundidesulfovibrio terrae]|uniref:C-GCAxxG-C-C family protein n=1 Tax=Fundidesulfovibrio terrae TaxID=2922866 RepID=UPI001FAE7BC9|nr:C-GCAxxG-C-C family protein [Fundidesulfovibrio terrae]